MFLSLLQELVQCFSSPSPASSSFPSLLCKFLICFTLSSSLSVLLLSPLLIIKLCSTLGIYAVLYDSIRFWRQEQDYYYYSTLTLLLHLRMFAVSHKHKSIIILLYKHIFSRGSSLIHETNCKLKVVKPVTVLWDTVAGYRKLFKNPPYPGGRICQDAHVIEIFYGC